MRSLEMSRHPFVGGFLAACMFAGSVPAAFAQDDALLVNAAVAPSTLDPAWACGIEEIAYIQNFYVRPFRYAVTEGRHGVNEIDYGTVEPYLVDTYEVSEDGLVYTLALKEGFEFESGAPVDAAAFKYSFERVLTMGGCGAYFITDGFLDPVIIESIETPDDYTVVITLNKPNASMPIVWATPASSIVDPAVVEANGGVAAGQPNEFMSSNVTASGPFKLEAYTPNQSADLVVNEAYGGEAPASDRIRVNWISAAPTLLLQARTAQADITMGLSKRAARTLEESEGIRVLPFSAPFAQQMILPNSKEPWTNVKVREAVHHAVPYQDILDRVAFGYGTLYYGPIMPSLPGFNAEISQPVPFDLERAKALMEESGLDLPVDVEVMIQEGDPTQQQLATILQSTWREIGINLSIKVAPAAEFQELSQGHKVQSLMRLNGPGVFEVGYLWGYDVLCDVVHNLTEVCIPEVDELTAELRRTTDADERQRIMDEAVELWRAAYPKILFFEDQPVIVLSDAVTSYTYGPIPEFRDWAAN